MTRVRTAQAISIDASPLIYARHLATYIRSPNTILARTLDEFGHAPTLAHIIAMVARNQPKKLHLVDDSDAFEPLEGWRPKPMPGFEVAAAKPRSVRRLEAMATQPFEPHLPDADMVPATPNEIIAAVAKAYDLAWSDIIGPSRSVPIVKARNLCAYVLRERGNSYPQVGRMLGGRDHSTIIHAIRNFKNKARPVDWEIAARYRKATRVAA